MYQVEPIGVVTPRDADDVIAAFDVARRQNVALLPRGGGTSLTGQTVNRALVLDFSQHMNGVLEVNAEELWARVQPGLVQDELNHAIRDLGLLFGPDTSTSNRATLGGMLGNNSGGSHSIAYGLTVEHVLELDALLADGTRVRFGTVTPAEFEAKMRLDGSEGRIYREVAAIRAEYADEIRARYPKHWRRVAGYNLNELVVVAGSASPDQDVGGLSEKRVSPLNGAPLNGVPINMARVVVGSEGTLLTVLEAKVRLVRRPKKTAVDVIHYASIQEALESSQSILETGPYAVELTDKLILDLARNNIEQRARAAFVQGDPGAILIVEYAGESDGEVASKVGEGDLGTHDHAEVGAIDGHVSPACALRRFGCLRGRGEASVGAVAVESPAQGSFEGRDGWLVRGEIREQDTGVQQPVGVEDPFDGTLDGDLHGSKALGHELTFLCADAVFARDGASHAESRINDFVVGLLQSTRTVGIGPVEE